jgi:AcrR family transcriptional regulator
LFRRSGFENTTTQEIAEAAEIAAGTLFTYVKTKEGLLILVFHEEMMELAAQALEKALNAKDVPLSERFIIFFSMLAEYHCKDVALSRSILRELAYVKHESERELVDKLMGVLFKNLGQITNAAKENKEIDPDTPTNSLSRVLFGTYDIQLAGLMNGYIDRQEFERVLRKDYEFICNNIVSR